MLPQQATPFPTQPAPQQGQMGQAGVNPIQGLFDSVNPQGTTVSPVLGKGSLVAFRYSFWIHDPVPLVIITDYAPGYKMRGVNLHYLTYPVIRNLLSVAASNPSFSYQNIAQDSYISSSFRTYKWNGISQVKKFDAQFILKMMSVARTFDPSQIHAIRQSVETQIQQEMLRKAQGTTEVPYNG